MGKTGTNREDDREKVTVSHPEYGHVVFSSPTPRQKEILNEYQKSRDDLEEVGVKIFNELEKKEDNNSQS